VKSKQSPTKSYPLLTVALRLLPDIRPMYERHRLGEAKHEAAHSADGTALLNGVSVTLLELEELFVDSERGSPRVSQQGAVLLLRLYQEGAFDFFHHRPMEGGLELLTQYSLGLASLIESRFWGKARRQRPLAPSAHAEHRKPRSHQPVVARHGEFIGTVHRLI